MPPLVLVVDDSDTTRAVMASRLRSRGAVVVTLASTEEAARVDPQLFSAALLDIELRDGWGTEIATRLRERAPAFPIAFLTAGPAPSLLDAASSLGPVFSKMGELDDAIEWAVGTDCGGDFGF